MAAPREAHKPMDLGFARREQQSSGIVLSAVVECGTRGTHRDGTVLGAVHDGDLSGRHAVVQQRLGQWILHDRRDSTPQRPRTVRLQMTRRGSACQQR